MNTIHISPEVKLNTPLADYDAVVFTTKHGQHLAVLNADMDTLVVFDDENEGRPVTLVIAGNVNTYEAALSDYYEGATVLREIESISDLLIEFSLR